VGLQAFRAKSGGLRMGFVLYWESGTERVTFDGVEKYRRIRLFRYWQKFRQWEDIG